MDFYIDEENCYNKLKEAYKKFGRLIIAVDFDDTLYDCHNSGKTYNDMINLLKRLEPYSMVVIWTNSPESRFPYIEDYLKKIGVKYEGINIDVVPEMAGRKMYANIYVDDHGGLPSTYRMLKRLIDEIESGLI